MNKAQIQAIKDAKTLLKQSEMTCSFTSQKKPTKRMIVMRHLLDAIKSEHKNNLNCIYDSEMNCLICDL